MKTKQTNKVGGGIKRQSFADCMLSLNVFPFKRVLYGVGSSKPSATAGEEDSIERIRSRVRAIGDSVDISNPKCRVFKDYDVLRPRTLAETYLDLHNRIKSNFDEAIAKFEREHYAKRFEKK